MPQGLERTTATSLVSALLVLLTGAVFAQQRQPQEQAGGEAGELRQTWTPPAGAIEIPYDAKVPLRLPPDVGSIGEVMGVAQDSKGNIYIYTHAGQQRIYEFDKTGKYMREIGKDSYAADWAHSIRVDKDDNIWIVDDGSNMVVKYNQAAQVVLTLGRKWEIPNGRPALLAPGAPRPRGRPNVFDRPTDVAWDSEGNIFVSERNTSRIAKFTKTGSWIKAWGQFGTGPGEFNLPHVLAVDARDRIYVGDRQNNRIQVFDTNGGYLKEFRGVGTPWALCITPGPTQYLYTADGTGHIYKLDLEGKILGYFGKEGREIGQFPEIHSLACVSDSELLVGEAQTWRVQRVTLRSGG